MFNSKEVSLSKESLFTQGWFVGMFTHIRETKQLETASFYAFPQVH